MSNDEIALGIINAIAAINALSEKNLALEEQVKKLESDNKKMLIDLIWCPTCNEFSRQASWIPVSEGSPDDGQFVLACGYRDDEKEPIYLPLHYFDSVGFISNITKWLPIPLQEKNDV